MKEEVIQANFDKMASNMKFSTVMIIVAITLTGIVLAHKS